MNNDFNLQLSALSTSLPSYYSLVNRIPLLSSEAEYSLAKQFQETNNIEAAKTLVLSHLRFVIKVARNYRGYGLSENDLIQEGNIGLMKAVKRFDPSLGVRLVSFAVHWIKAEIHEFIIKNWKIVKVATTKAQRKLFFKLRGMKKTDNWMTTREIEEVASKLSVDTKDVEIMESRLANHDLFLDSSESDQDTAINTAKELTTFEADPFLICQNIEKKEIESEFLRNGLISLDERSRDIVVSRWLSDPKATLTKLAAKYKISSERVRQLEKEAFTKMKDSALQNKSQS